MVSNTAGTATDLPATKENGNCKKHGSATEDSSSNTKQNLKDKANLSQIENFQKNDSNKTMSGAANDKLSEESNVAQASNVNAVAGNSYNAKGYSNGIPVYSTSTNGPHQASGVSYANYPPYNHNNQAYSGKSGPPRPSQSNQKFSSMQPRYPISQQPVATPTLNQLLTAPSRPPSQYDYGSQPGHPSQLEYAQQASKPWPSKAQQDRLPVDPSKPDLGGSYPSQPNYPTSQHSNFPPQYNHYPSPTGNQPPYHSQSQYNNALGPTAQSRYPSNIPEAQMHPTYSAYPGFSGSSNSGQQTNPYYPQRPPHPQAGFTDPASNQPPAAAPAIGEAQSHFQQQQQQQDQQTLHQTSDKMFPQSKDNMMSPKRGTPQPQANTGAAPSPMNPAMSHGHPGHPSVVHFRGPSSTPGSPGVASQTRSTPLSPPPSVRSDSSQPPMRPASGHSEHSNPPVPSPVPGGPNYASYRSHPAQPPYGWQPPNYPQHVMSQQLTYSGNQPHSTPVHPQGAPSMRPSSAGKPTQPISQAYTQSQAVPPYSQPGGHMPYYDNMPQAHHVMQGYSSASPAPSERRPSRQGSHPPPVLTPEPNTRQGAAAAAAAAAMAAAAHSAQPGQLANSKPPPSTYYQQLPQHRMPHPSFANAPTPGVDLNQQNYPRMPHPGALTSGPPQRLMGPHGAMALHPGQGSYRMPPPSHYPPGYGQPMGPTPQPGGPYPGYYPPSDLGHGHAPRPSFHPSAAYPPQPPVQEETPKKPSARSASQKLAALFEPADEPGRREFIENVIRYWEEKDVPLKNAPLMGRKTLDLFRLYHIVKERGGMVEVTSGKKWPEISATLNLGTTSSSGFTLKKQYCKYLYGYECKVEKGIPEPQEAMARITEANRKRKQMQDNAKETAHPAPAPVPSPAPGPPPVHSHSSNLSGPPAQLPYTAHQYPHPGPGQPYVSRYKGHPTSAPMTLGGVPHHSGQMNATPQSVTPMTVAPPPMVNSPRSWTQQPVYGPGPGPQPTQSEIGSDSVKNDALPPPDTKPPVSTGPAADPVSSIKPPLPSSDTLAAADPFSDPLSAPVHPSMPGPPRGYARHPDLPHPPQHPGQPGQNLQRPTRPPMMSAPHPFSNSPLPQPNSLRGPALSGEVHGAPSPGPRPPSGYHPTPPMPTRPPGHSMVASLYPTPGSMVNSYAGMKRPSGESYGPPRKYMRPDLHHPPPTQAPYRPGTDFLRHRFPGDATSGGNAYRPSGPGNALVPSSQARIHSPYPPPHRFPRYPTPNDKLNRGGHFARTALKLRQSAQSPHAKYPADSRANLRRQLQMSRFYSQPMKREMTLFPPGSIEATPLKLSKFQRKTCQNLGLIESWRLVMSLKSGLLVESAWALNVLSVLLYDHKSVAQFRLSQLPCLLDAVVDHFRRNLSEIFSLPSELDALGLPSFNDPPDDLDADVFESEELCAINRANHWRKKRKVSKFKNKHASYKIKVETRPEGFLLDSSRHWDDSTVINSANDLSHIILSISRGKLTENGRHFKNADRDQTEAVRCLEATLEDVLSIPSSILSPDDDDPKNDRSKSEDGDQKAEVMTETLPVENGTKEEVSPPMEKIPKPECGVELETDVLCAGDEQKGSAASSTSDEPEMVVDEDRTDESSSSKKACEQKVIAPLCNGLQMNFAHRNEPNGKHQAMTEAKATDDHIVGSDTTASEKKPAETDDKSLDKTILDQLSLTNKVQRILKDRNVVLLEDEAAGSEGSLADPLSGPLLCAKASQHRSELTDRLLSISNILRSLSFIPSNLEELIRQRYLMRVLSGILLLRHKHKVRVRRDLINLPPEPEAGQSKSDSESNSTMAQDRENEKLCKSDKICPGKVNCVSRRKSSRNSVLKSISTEAVVAREESKKEPVENAEIDEQVADRDLSLSASARKKCLFSATVLDEDDQEEALYKDPWWWDCVRRLREDALVMLANMSSSLDLSVLPDDCIPLAILEACLHWVVCPSSDASDAFSWKQRDPLSAQRLSIEILTKLSIKDQNVDLILATRPYSRVEKLFLYLVNAIGDRKDSVLREFSIVLLSNLSRGDPSAARAIALQKGSISNIVTYLEECEETGHSHRQMFQRQQETNGGINVFMMVKAAQTLHAMAMIPENKSSFIKQQLRLLSLSMSHILGSRVTTIISSLLFELSHEAT